MPVHDLTGSATPAVEDGRLESAAAIVEVSTSDDALVLTESDGTTVVELYTGEPATLLISEPVTVDPRPAGIGIADLADVDTSEAPTNVPLVWMLGSDGVWRTTNIDAARWGEEIRFSDEEPDVSAAPLGATWVDYDDGTIYRAEEAP